jgi:hypothetical protein
MTLPQYITVIANLATIFIATRIASNKFNNWCNKIAAKFKKAK